MTFAASKAKYNTMHWSNNLSGIMCNMSDRLPRFQNLPAFVSDSDE